MKRSDRQGGGRPRDDSDDHRLRKRRKEDRRHGVQEGTSYAATASGGGARLRSPADDRNLSEEETEARSGARRSRGRRGDDSDEEEAAFVWTKKNAMLRRKGVRVTQEDEAARRARAAEELERAKARREERQRERDQVDAERAREARMREQEMNADWDRKEESFHGHQHFLRQSIRLREGRPTLADTFARNLRLDLPEIDHDPRSPCDVLAQMGSAVTREALRELLEAVEMELDCVADFSADDDTDVFNRELRLEWWTCANAYVSDLMTWMPAEAERDKAGDASEVGAGVRFNGVHPSVQKELDDMLNGKAGSELKEMEAEISMQLSQGPDRRNDDDYGEVDFWQAALGRIKRGIAQLRIKELNGVIGAERKKILAAMPVDEREEQLRASRYNNVIGDDGEGHLDMGEEAMVRAEASKGMARDEEQFAELAEVRPEKGSGHHGFAWNDKYRPRRPRFYNRVQTGYDWNKYNRTHYDHDNPPPKTVQGYKFNVFYPDLLNKSKAPTFDVAKTDNPEVCILTFKAGPPYEDLAFKIVSRPWEHSHRRGFRCVFDRGVLQLWFNFRRLRYRR